MAKVKVVEFGLDLAKRIGISKLQVQMDNKATILALQDDEAYGGMFTHIIHRCRQMILDSSWKIDTNHYYQEGDRVANWLAN